MKPSTASVTRSFGNSALVAPPKDLLPPPDPAVDRAIIEAMIEGEDFSALYRTGLTEKAVNDRAGKLGLTREFIKRCRLAGTRPAMRSCVKCDARFLSAGNHNRLCGRCPAR